MFSLKFQQRLGTFSKTKKFSAGRLFWRRRIMPYSVPRWSADDIAKLKSMAQKYPTTTIAAQLGRSTAATIVKAHELKLSLRVRPKKRELVSEPGPSGLELGKAGTI
jgi:hypothetical protein